MFDGVRKKNRFSKKKLNDVRIKDTDFISIIEVQLQHFLHYSKSELDKLSEDELVNEYGKMKWLLEKKAKAYTEI